MKKKKTIYQSSYANYISLLRAERIRLGMSQKQVSELLDMSQSDLSKIETCERRLDILELKMMLKIFRVSESSILARETKSFFFENL